MSCRTRSASAGMSTFETDCAGPAAQAVRTPAFQNGSEETAKSAMNDAIRNEGLFVLIHLSPVLSNASRPRDDFPGVVDRRKGGGKPEEKFSVLCDGCNAGCDKVLPTLPVSREVGNMCRAFSHRQASSSMERWPAIGSSEPGRFPASRGDVRLALSGAEGTRHKAPGKGEFD